MGLGSAMAGGNPAVERHENDFYATPPDVTRALLSVERFEGPIHECASGNGAMAMVLQAAGYEVIGTDIRPLGFGRRMDFFDIKEKLADNIVSNPPFKLAKNFIEHGLGVLKVRKMALMLKSTYWHASTRYKIFGQFRPSAIYPLLWRPDFLSKGAPTMEVMWCVWDQDAPQGVTRYQPLPRPR